MIEQLDLLSMFYGTLADIATSLVRIGILKEPVSTLEKASMNLLNNLTFNFSKMYSNDLFKREKRNTKKEKYDIRK